MYSTNRIASSISMQKAACYNSVKRVLTNAFDHSIQFLFMGDLVGCLFQRNSGYQINCFWILYLSLCVVLFPSINRVMVKLKKWFFLGAILVIFGLIAFQGVQNIVTKNPEKSRDFSFKNPGILVDVKSRDPGIPGIPLGPGQGSLLFPKI